MAVSDVWLWELSPAELSDQAVFNEFWPWMKKAEQDTGGKWPATVIREQALKREITLFAAVEGGRVICLAAVHMYAIKDGTQIGNIVFCVAKRHTLDRWIKLFPHLLHWMKSRGCHRIEGQFRRGYERVLKGFGLKPTHTVFEGVLTHV